MITQRVDTGMATVFAHGAYLMSVEAELDFDKRQAGVEDSQKRDKDTGIRLWSAIVLDGDPEAQRRRQAEVKVVIAAEHQPEPPELLPGTPFRPVEFEGLTLFAYPDTSKCRPPRKGEEHRCRARVAYSLRATGMRSPMQSSSAQAGGSRSNKTAATSSEAA